MTHGSISLASPQYDWPFYRGINHDGISLEKELNIKDPKVIWESNVGTGFSAVTVANGNAYTMGNRAEKDTIYCLNAETGKIVWSYTYDCKLGPKYYEGGPGATPTIYDNKVYTLSKEGHIFCLAADTGSVLWSHDAQKEFGATPPTWGFAGSPTIIGGSVVYNVGARGLSLHRNTGKMLWNSGGKSAGYASAVPFDVKGKSGILMFSGNKLFGVNRVNGDLFWTYSWKTSHDINAAAPIVFSPYVFVSSGYNEGCTVIDISKSNPEELWMNKNLRNHFSSSVMWKGKLYGIDGNTGKRNKLVCLNAVSGTRLWSQKDFGMGSLIMADDKLLILVENGELVFAEVNPSRYVEINRLKILDGKCWTVPTLSNGRLYARNAHGKIVCLDMTKH